MTKLNTKKGGFKKFMSRLGKMIINNWQYKLLAAATAFVLWLVIPYVIGA